MLKIAKPATEDPNDNVNTQFVAKPLETSKHTKL